METLTELLLHQNQLVQIPPGIGDLSSVTEIVIARNKLTTLPASEPTCP